MTIEILETKIENNFSTGQPSQRSAEIIITNGPGSYLLSVGGLPLAGNLQTILDGREGELWQAALVSGKPVDLYELTPRKILKSVMLVMLDEINLLRQQAGLQARTGAQLEAAIKAKLKAL